MPVVHEGRLDASKKKIAIVAGRFNEPVTSRLVSAAIDCFVRHGGDDASVEVFWVPGSFEVPQMARRIARERKFHGLLCLGALVRGETNHFDILSASVLRSLADVAAEHALPVGYGIVTADTLDQAMNRAGGKNGNKGWDSAMALIEMMSLWGG